MSRRPSLSRRSLAAIAVLSTLAAATVASPAGAFVRPAPSVSAWVVTREPGDLGQPFTPGPKDQGNSRGGTNRVTRTAIGQFEVRLGGLVQSAQDGLGTVQVTPLSNVLRWCRADEWGVDGNDLLVLVSCGARNGTPADSKFALTYLAGTGSHGSAGGRLAYAWTDDSTTPGTPSESYQHSSAGTVISMSRTATGRYTLTIPDMGVTGGNVQVTSYEAFATCHPTSWAPSGDDKVIRIACRTPTGADVNTVMDVLFLSKNGPEGFGGGPSAYLWANKPKASSYQPAESHRYNSAGKAITVLRARKGVYTVILAGMPAGGAAIVTASGAGKAHCQLSSLGSQVPMKAIVRCYAPSGSLTDSQFTLAYTK